MIISLMPASFGSQVCACLDRSSRRLQQGGLPVSLPLKGFVTVALTSGYPSWLTPRTPHTAVWTFLTWSYDLARPSCLPKAAEL